MSNVVSIVNSAVFNYIKEPFFIIVSVFALLTAVTFVIVAYEMRKRKK